MKIGFELEMRSIPVHLYEYAVVAEKTITKLHKKKNRQIPCSMIVCRRVNKMGDNRFTGRFWVPGKKRGERVDTYNLTLFKMPIGNGEFLECKIDHRIIAKSEIDFPERESGHGTKGRQIKALYKPNSFQFPICEIVSTPIKIAGSSGMDSLSGLAYFLNMICLKTQDGDFLTPERIKSLLDAGKKKRHFHSRYNPKQKFEILNEEKGRNKPRSWKDVGIGYGLPMTKQKRTYFSKNLQIDPKQRPTAHLQKTNSGYEASIIPGYKLVKNKSERATARHTAGLQMTFGFDLARAHMLLINLLTDRLLFVHEDRDEVGTKVIRDVMAYVLRQSNVLESREQETSGMQSRRKTTLSLIKDEISPLEGYTLIANLYLELCVAYQNDRILTTHRATQLNKKGGVSVTKNVFPFILRSRFRETAKLIPLKEQRLLAQLWNKNEKNFSTIYKIGDLDKLKITGNSNPITFRDLVRSMFDIQRGSKELVDHMGGLYRVPPEDLFTKTGRKGPVIELRYMSDLSLEIGSSLKNYQSILGQLNMYVQKLIGINTGALGRKTLEKLNSSIYKKNIGEDPYWRNK